jgi:hypothetical protein
VKKILRRNLANVHESSGVGQRVGRRLKDME